MTVLLKIVLRYQHPAFKVPVSDRVLVEIRPEDGCWKQQEALRLAYWRAAKGWAERNPSSTLLEISLWKGRGKRVLRPD